MGDLDKNESSSNEIDESFDLDDLLPIIGEFGKYQKYLLFFICLPACIPCGFCAFNQVFMTDSPVDYWCATNNVTVDLNQTELKRFTIPYNSFSGYDKCHRYKINWTLVADENFSLIDVNTSWPIEKCSDGWNFEGLSTNSSIISQFNLVCDRDIYPTLALVALNLGGPIGVYSFGILNDRYGRKISYFCCLTTLLVGSFLTALSSNFWTWAFSRVIVGSTVPAIYQIPFIIALELVGPHYRSFVTVMTCTFYSFGLMLLAVVTYYIRDWVHLCWFTSLPFLSYYLYIFILPESPRWLLSKGKLQKALEILENMAKTNKKQIPEWFRANLHSKLREMNNKSFQESETFSAIDLFRTPNMRLKTILITLNWFANETVYLGLSYYGPNLGSNQYVSFFLSSLVELPSYVICWIAMDKWGRRWPLSILMIFGGICCIATVLLPTDAINETLALYLISKSMISASFLIIYPFAGELYPTEIRGVGIGFSSYVGGIGLIIIPFVNYLGQENLVLPLVIMGILIMLGGLTALRLPETLHKKLPATLDEGEVYGKDWAVNNCLVYKKDSENSSEPREIQVHFQDKTNIDIVTVHSKNTKRQSMKHLIRQEKKQMHVNVT
uniref:CSON007163 protein n=1 Tax=Culicoides sonorensis TaxID=179676 RepID=A0A336LNX3_CULSO